jgi:hypothetical protein
MAAATAAGSAVDVSAANRAGKRPPDFLIDLLPGRVCRPGSGVVHQEAPSALPIPSPIPDPRSPI